MVWKHNGIGAPGSEEGAREQQDDAAWIRGLGTVMSGRLCRDTNGVKLRKRTRPALSLLRES